MFAACIIIIISILCLGAFAFAYREGSRRGVQTWLGTYVRRHRRWRTPRAAEPVHVLFCIGDHYEPRHGGVDPAQAMRRVEAWVREYPRQFDRFRDADGRPPQYSFFYPLEEYDRAEMDALAGLCRAGYGEVEVHLHHDNDTADNLRRRLLEYKELLARDHGLLARHRRTGELAYGFIHGNWALDNSRPDGRWCGVNNELDVLRDTGCYADFTMPSAPSPTQTRKINSIYWAVDDPCCPKSHDTGLDLAAGPKPENGLLMIQGPLVLDWGRRRYGVLPRVENGCIQANQVPTVRRLDQWLRARVQVPTRPDWFFVKVYTHGAPEANAAVLLGDPMVRFHEDLARRAADNPNFHVHYVTAREMYNLARAAEAGWTGSVNDARDFELVRNGVTDRANGQAPLAGTRVTAA